MQGNTGKNYNGGTPPLSGQSAELNLAEKVRQLQADRQRHAQAINQIDQVLERVENALAALKGVPPKPRRSTPPIPQKPIAPTTPRAHRHYRKFEMTGEESVMDFVRRHGSPTTAQINANWHAQGRTGVANPILARLLKQGRLLRQIDPSVRGSRYRINPQRADESSSPPVPA